MLMLCFKKYKRITKLTNYGIHERLRERGYKISIQALDNYDKDSATGVRADVHVGMDELGKEITGKEFLFTTFLHEEFSTSKSKKG